MDAGARLVLIASGVATTYTQDLAAGLPVVLQAKTGSTTTQYVFSMGTHPLSEYNGAWEYLLADGLGSMRQIVNASGDVTLTKSYQPYGEVLNSAGTGTSIFGYSGEQTDATGLVFLRARYMHPGLGRFLSHDSWGGDKLRPQTMNGWSYANANPTNQVDAAGLCAFETYQVMLALTSGDDIVCTVVPGDHIYQIGRTYGVPDNKLDQLTHYQFKFRGPDWDARTIHAGSKIYIPQSLMDIPDSVIKGNPQPIDIPQPSSGFLNPGWVVDGYAEGSNWFARYPHIDGHPIMIDDECYIEGVIGAGSGEETLINLKTGDAADYHYDFLIYNNPYFPSATTGNVGTAGYYAFVNGFDRKLTFEHYSGFFTCHSTSITGSPIGVSRIVGVGGAIGLCRTGPQPPFEIDQVPFMEFNLEAGFDSVTFEASTYLGALSIDTPGIVLALYYEPRLRDARQDEVNNARQHASDALQR